MSPELRRADMSAGELLMCLACLALSLCGHHLLHAYHGPRLKLTAKTCVRPLCVRVSECVHVFPFVYTFFKHVFLDGKAFPCLTVLILCAEGSACFF